MEEREEEIPASVVGWRIWFTTWLLINIAFCCIRAHNGDWDWVDIAFLSGLLFIAGVPAFIALTLAIGFVVDRFINYTARLIALYSSLLFVSIGYGTVALAFGGAISFENILVGLIVAGVLFGVSVIAVWINNGFIQRYLCYGEDNAPVSFSLKRFLLNLNTSAMFSDPTPQMAPRNTDGSSNKILIKSIITAAIILVMLIPTAFIQSLVMERQDRQKEVVNEISSKWGKAANSICTIPCCTLHGGRHKKTAYYAAGTA